MGSINGFFNLFMLPILLSILIHSTRCYSANMVISSVFMVSAISRLRANFASSKIR